MCATFSVAILKEIACSLLPLLPLLTGLNLDVLLVNWLRIDLGNGGRISGKETGCLSNLAFLPASSKPSI